MMVLLNEPKHSRPTVLNFTLIFGVPVTKLILVDGANSGMMTKQCALFICAIANEFDVHAGAAHQ